MRTLTKINLRNLLFLRLVVPVILIVILLQIGITTYFSSQSSWMVLGVEILGAFLLSSLFLPWLIKPILLLQSTLKSKDELLLEISHELRSPLTNINALIELINDEKRKNQIRSNLYRMERLVEELLETHSLSSEHTHAHFEKCQLKEMLASITQRYPNVVTSCPELEVEVDKRYLDRLLTNLIENALKYSKEAGSPVEVKVAELGEKFQVEVMDSGIGIPEADIPHLFEPFYRVDKSRNKNTGGFGLGLFLVARICQLHRGSIVAKNRENAKGASFTVILPKTQTNLG